MVSTLITLAVWIPLSVVLALVLGRVMRERDRHRHNPSALNPAIQGSTPPASA